MVYKAAVFAGLPGSGKSAVSRSIATEYGMLRLSTGELGDRIRQDPRHPLHEQVSMEFDRDGIYTDETAIAIFCDWRTNNNPGSRVLLLDGVPRTTEQAELLSLGVRVAYRFDAPEDLCLARIQTRLLKEGRDDDASEQKTRSKIRFYHERTLPMLEHYAAQGVPVIPVPAKEPLSVVRRAVLTDLITRF